MIRLLFVATLCFVLPCFNAYGTGVQSDRKPVVLSVEVSEGTNATPGAKIVIEIIADVTKEPDSNGKHWHIYPRAQQHKGVETATRITAKSESSSTVVGEVEWPKTKITRNATGEFQPVYEGRTVFKIPVQIAADAMAREYKLDIAFSYQTCASRCLAPTTENLEAVIVVKAATTNSPPADAIPAKPPTVSPAKEPATEKIQGPLTPVTRDADAQNNGDFQTSLFGTQFGFSANSVFAIPLLLLFSFIGGFLLNLTPCVLPIIPIKIMGLTQSAAGDARRAKVLGVSMGFGILAFWLAIGVAISFVSGFNSISSLFQRPVFGISVGLFIAVMGIGMLVDMSIQLPQAVHKINPKHDTLYGAFLFGVMTAVLSTPCTAPFMGSAAAWATKANNSALVITVFGAIAVGMGWPYVLLSWFPKLVSKVPRTGPASVLVKQVMGLLMLAVAAFFGGTGILGLIKELPHLGPVLHWWIATAFVGAMSIWMTLQTFQITKSFVKRLGYSILSAALFGGMVYWSNGETADSWQATERHQAEADSMKVYVTQLEHAVQNGGVHSVTLKSPGWRDYDPEAFARVKAKGQIAIVHFTADW